MSNYTKSRDYEAIITDMFLERVRKADASGRQLTENYYKWFTTAEIKNLTGACVNKLRESLKSLKEAGKIVCTNHDGGVLWCVASVDGFKQSKFKDFLTRV